MLYCVKYSCPGISQDCAEAGLCAHRSAGEEDARPDKDFSRLEQRIAAAAERRAAAQKQFDRLCFICIAAQQAHPLCADRGPSFPHLLLQPRPACLLLRPEPFSSEQVPPSYCGLEWTMPTSASREYIQVSKVMHVSGEGLKRASGCGHGKCTQEQWQECGAPKYLRQLCFSAERLHCECGGSQWAGWRSWQR